MKQIFYINKYLYIFNYSINIIIKINKNCDLCCNGVNYYNILLISQTSASLSVIPYPNK